MAGSFTSCFYTSIFISNSNHLTMKRYQLASAFVFLALLTGQFVAAQEVAVKGSGTAVPLFTKNLLSTEMISAPDASYPNDRLRSRFTILFPDATGVEWKKMTDCYYVSFQDRGRKSRAVFTSEGVMNYAITDCRLEGLPETFRSKITLEYPDYTPLNAIEIRVPGGRTYQAILENATGYVTLRGAADGINVTSQQKLTGELK